MVLRSWPDRWFPAPRAVEPFKKEFDAKYVKKEPGTDAEKEFAAAVAQAKCNVCHAGTSKKMRNDYGKALGTLLKKADAKNIPKIQKRTRQSRRNEVGCEQPQLANLR